MKNVNIADKILPSICHLPPVNYFRVKFSSALLEFDTIYKWKYSLSISFLSLVFIYIFLLGRASCLSVSSTHDSGIEDSVSLTTFNTVNHMSNNPDYNC